MIFRIISANKSSGHVVKLRCPGCGHKGTFDPLDGIPDVSIDSGEKKYFIVGQRKCPDGMCTTHLFFILNNLGEILETYPVQRIDFDKENIPPEIISVFEEALTCHANKCYIAAGIMIRRTLEELCHNKGAQGSDLKTRIVNLGEKIVIPKEFIDGMHELRLLGNDAAHVKSQDYENIGQEEIEVSLDFTKEILKAVYQYEGLLKRLAGFKKKAGDDKS